MDAWRTALAVALVASALAAPARADECEATAANIHAQHPEIAISERTSQDQTVIVALKNPHVEELTLTCANGDVSQPAELTAKANATWPSSDFYDVLSSAGSVLTSAGTSAIRSGSVLCAQRAMASDNNNAVYDINGMHFECTTTSGAGGSTLIHVSKLKEAAPQ